MGYNTLALGLTLTIPTSGTRNWGSQLYNTTWTKISSHDHTGGGNGNQIGTTALANNSVTSAKLAPNIAFKRSTLAPTGSSPTASVDWSTGNIYEIDASGASGTLTINFSNEAAGGFYRIYLTQPVSVLTVTFGSTIKWPQGQAPIYTASGIDKLDFYYNGTSFYGDWEPAYA